MQWASEYYGLAAKGASLDQLLANASFSESALFSRRGIARAVGKLLSGHPFPQATRIMPGRLFRARLDEEPNTPWSNIKDVWYPPARYSTQQRFNQAGAPRLYLNGNGLMAASEVGLQCGSTYTIAEFRLRQVPKLQLLGMAKTNSNAIHESGFDLSRGYRDILNFLAAHEPARVTYDRVEGYCLTLATKPGDNIFSYNASSALADMLFSKPDVDGIVYPSCKSLYCSTNVCLSPNFADKHAFVSKLWNVRLHDIVRLDENNGHVMWALNGCTTTIDENGSVDWDVSAISGTPTDELYDIGGNAEENRLRHGQYAGEGGMEQLARDIYG